MKVHRNGDTFLATRVTGPTHNVLGLDFSPGVTKYVKDLAGGRSPSVDQASVIEQVDQAMDELDVDRAELAGVQFDGNDTPSEDVYYELAKVIIEYRRNHEQVEELAP